MPDPTQLTTRTNSYSATNRCCLNTHLGALTWHHLSSRQTFEEVPSQTAMWNKGQSQQTVRSWLQVLDTMSWLQVLDTMSWLQVLVSWDKQLGVLMAQMLRQVWSSRGEVMCDNVNFFMKALWPIHYICWYNAGMGNQLKHNTGNTTFTCSVCGSSMANQVNHNIGNTGNTIFNCSTCGCSMANQVNFNTTLETPYLIVVCVAPARPIK